MQKKYMQTLKYECSMRTTNTYLTNTLSYSNPSHVILVAD